jgi:hypothetical protein
VKQGCASAGSLQSNLATGLLALGEVAAAILLLIGALPESGGYYANFTELARSGFHCQRRDPVFPDEMASPRPTSSFRTRVIALNGRLYSAMVTSPRFSIRS